MPYIFIACLKFNLKTWGSFIVKVPRARHVIIVWIKTSFSEHYHLTLYSIWLNTNRQKFNSMCTVLILSCDPSDPIRRFLTELNCFEVFYFQAVVLKIGSDYFLDFVGRVPAKQWKTIFSIFFPSFPHVSE